MRLHEWSFALEHEERKLATWSWTEFQQLPQTEITVDIHCVTSWSKLDTRWKGVTIETLLEIVGLEPPESLVGTLSSLQETSSTRSDSELNPLA